MLVVLRRRRSFFDVPTNGVRRRRDLEVLRRRNHLVIAKQCRHFFE